jgi:hypothetical protein
MVINEVRNTEAEQAARKYVKELFEGQGYRVLKGKKGCDFIARRKKEVIPIEVKGRRTLDMNFTIMSRWELETLRSNSNARVVLVFVNSGIKALVGISLTNDDIEKAEVSSYRIKWKGTIKERMMNEMQRQVQAMEELLGAA